MTACDSNLPYDFYSRRSLVVRFSDLELSSDAGILLARQAEQQMQVCQAIADCIQEWRDPNKITHRLPQLVSQRVYSIFLSSEVYCGSQEPCRSGNSMRFSGLENAVSNRRWLRRCER